MDLRLLQFLIIAILSGSVSQESWSQSVSYGLQTSYHNIKDKLVNTAFDAPISISTHNKNNTLQAEILGIVNVSIEDFVANLSQPAQWCNFIILTFNIKSCVHHTYNNSPALTVYVGHKFFESVGKSFVMRYHFELISQDNRVLDVKLTANKGIMGTRDCIIQLQAIEIDGKTFVRFMVSYQQSVISSMLTAGYLATVGRNKVGFTMIDYVEGESPIYVKGTRGIIERNAMRYYLALIAFFNVQNTDKNQNFISRLNTWYDFTEKYHRQLYEMSKEKYLETKIKEYTQQVELQQQTGAGIHLPKTQM